MHAKEEKGFLAMYFRTGISFERDRMRNVLSDRGASLRREELLARPEARTVVAEFMIRTGLLGQFQAVDPMALGMEEGDDKA